MQSVKMTKSLILMVLTILSVTSVYAQPASSLESPLVLMQTTANVVIKDLKYNRGTLKQNPDLIYRIVQKNLLPIIDVRGMSRSVLGRDVWRNATKDQRQRFSEQFTRLVVRTYSGALSDYSSEEIKFRPLRENYRTSSRLIIYSTIVRTQGPSIPLSYRMIRKKLGWRVYDMTVEGVSLLQSFRSQFHSELSRGDIDNLINKIDRLNKKRV